MIDLKQEISSKISKCINTEVSKEYIEIPPDNKMGDYSFPCFRLAKELKKSPQIIANEIKEKIELDDIINKVEVIGGYLNFYIDNQELTKIVLNEINDKKDKYGSSNIGNNGNVVIDYSAPNIAKPFHIGHLRSTVIGGALYNIYNFLGYNSIGVNH